MLMQLYNKGRFNMSINELEDWLKADKTKIIDWKTTVRDKKVALVATVCKGEDSSKSYELEVTYRLHYNSPADYYLKITNNSRYVASSHYYSMSDLMSYLENEGYLIMTESDVRALNGNKDFAPNIIEVDSSYEPKDYESIVTEPLDETKVKIKPFYTLNYRSASGSYNSISELKPVIVAVLGDYSTGEDVLTVEVTYEGDVFRCEYLYGNPKRDTQTVLHNERVSDIKDLDFVINQTLLRFADKITDTRFIAYGEEPKSFDSERFKPAPFGYLKNNITPFLHAKNIFNATFTDELRVFAKAIGDIDRFKVMDSVSSKTAFRYRTHLINVHQTGYIEFRGMGYFDSDLINLQWGYDSDVDKWYAYLYYANSPSYAPDLIDGMIKVDTSKELFEKVLLSFAKAGLDFNILLTAHNSNGESYTKIQEQLKEQLEYLEPYFNAPTIQFPWELDEVDSTDTTKVFKLNEHTTWTARATNHWGDFVCGAYVPGDVKISFNEIRIKYCSAGYQLGTWDYFYNGGNDEFFLDWFKDSELYFPTLDDVNEFLTSQLLAYVIDYVLNGKFNEDELKAHPLIEVTPTKESSQIEFEELNEITVDVYTETVGVGVLEFELKAKSLSNPLLHLQLNLLQEEPKLEHISKVHDMCDLNSKLDVPSLRPNRVFDVLKNTIESFMILESENEFKFRIGTLIGYDFKTVKLAKEASTICVEWEKRLDDDFVRKTFNTSKALVSYPADFEDAIDVTFIITFKGDKFHLSMSEGSQGGFREVATGVSIDELTAKAKLEMVKLGKSGKVFGNKD